MEKNKRKGSSIRDTRVSSLGAQVHYNTAAACNNCLSCVFVPVVVERYACFDRLHTAIIVPSLFMSLLPYVQNLNFTDSFIVDFVKIHKMGVQILIAFENYPPLALYKSFMKSQLIFFLKISGISK